MTIISFPTRRRPHLAALGTPGPGARATGSFSSPRSGVGVFSGSYRIAGLVSQHGRLALDGVFAGTLVDSDGSHIGMGSRRHTAPVLVSAVGGALELVVGPLEIDLLGFRVTIEALPVDLPAAVREDQGAAVTWYVPMTKA